MPQLPTIGRAELRIFCYVADHQPVTIGAVSEAIAEPKGQVRTTILNVMERLRKKRFLSRKKINGLFHYSARVPKETVLRDQIEVFVQKGLGGSIRPIVAFLAQQAKSDKALADQLRSLLRKK